MRLPGAENAVIEPRKIRDYLLSPTHPVGRHKAAFFSKLGYEQEDWGALIEALRVHAVGGEATELDPTAYGRKFKVRGEIRGPNQQAEVVTLWIILEGEDWPRLITAYPGGKP